MISNDVGEGGLRRDARNRAQLPAVLAPPVEDALADQRASAWAEKGTCLWSQSMLMTALYA